jgi:hypothetical protein
MVVSDEAAEALATVEVVAGMTITVAVEQITTPVKI